MLATCLVVALVPVFVSLGDWQYNKAQEKLARQATLEQRLADPRVDVQTLEGAALTDIEYRPARLHGRYLTASGFLLDNQVAEGRAGYAAITPFRLSSGGVVLVNRGWLPAAPDHRTVPVISHPSGTTPVTGLAVALPRPGLKLAGADTSGTVRAWIDREALSTRLGEPVADWMLVVDPHASDSLRVEWPQPASRVHTNLGYAWQWFGFAVASLGIFVWHGLRRARRLD